jgi:iron complex outermembrane receptor protein
VFALALAAACDPLTHVRAQNIAGQGAAGALKVPPPTAGSATPTAETAKTTDPATTADAEKATDKLTPSGKSVDGLNLDMKLDDLVRQDVVIPPAMSTVVTTVDRRESTVGRSPAAIFVITPEMIKRSGVRSIPEALRMAPGLDVAKLDSSTCAISARGFNNAYANKLLVQIDGRIVYNATFGGVYWDMQDVVLEDVERIEVIRGPGTTAWGSNAVNGVINIITKKSSDTQGAFVQSGGGNQERNFNTLRYGGRTSEDLTWRAYGQQFERNSGWSDTGIGDAWRSQRTGFRMDYTPTKEDTLTVQGDLFNGYAGQQSVIAVPVFPYESTINDRAHFDGGNVLLRYGHVIDDETNWQFQSYFDRYQQNTAPFAETRNAYDIDLQYQFSPLESHQIITGANYRNSPNQTRGDFSFNLTPDDFTTQWASVFAQDTMAIVDDRLYFTLGTRLEYNTFGKFQVEPTARLLLAPNDRQSVWAAVSRAVRNPMRTEAQSVVRSNVVGPGVPLFSQIDGNPNVDPENLMAYEIGYRAAPDDFFSWDIAGFINDYRKLVGLGAPGAPILIPPDLMLIPSLIENNTSAVSYGFETTATYQMNERWRLFGSYSLFEINVRAPTPLAEAAIEGSSPHNQIYIRSSWDLASNTQFDLIGRYVDRLTALDVPKYIEMDARLSWQITKTMEASFVGQNLLNNHHFEFDDALGGLSPTAVRRGWYAMLSWTY